MKIDKDNPPPVVWHVNRERIRKGHGVQRLEPLLESWDHGTLFSTFNVRGRKSRYWADECHATQEEAQRIGSGLLRQELRKETTRHCGVMERLKAAENALKGIKA